MDGLGQIEKNRFVIFGRAGMDFSAEPPGMQSENAECFRASLGGSSANIGAALTRHGGSVSLVTCVSDDAVGRYCLNQLAHYGIDSSHVRTVGSEARTSLAVTESRWDDHQTVIYRNIAADFQMSKADVAAVDYSAYGALVTTGTVFAAEPSRSAAFHGLALAKSVGLPIVFDIDYRPYSWSSDREATDVYEKVGGLCDIIVGNDDEFGFMAGEKEKGLSKARALATSTAKIVVYKMGENGAVTITREGEFQTGIFPVDALKPTGAGDAFLGNFLAHLASGEPLRDAIVKGSAAAAIVVSKVGCAPAMPNADALEAFMASHPTPEIIEGKDHAYRPL